MIELADHPSGVLLAVRAQPGARKNELRGEFRGALKVAVTQAPEKGKANSAVVDVLCRSLGLSRSQFTLVAGKTAQDKQFVVAHISRAELAARIQSALG